MSMKVIATAKIIAARTRFLFVPPLVLGRFAKRPPILPVR
jgi:hypothetical protein